MNTDNNGSNGNKGNRGRFSDRLKKMRRDRLKRRKNVEIIEKNERVLKRGGRNFLKIFLALPSVVYTNITDTNKKKEVEKKSDIRDVDSTKIKEVFQKNNNQNNNVSVNNEDKITNKKIKVNKIREIDVSLLKKQKELLVKENKCIEVNQNKETDDDNQQIKETLYISKGVVLEREKVSVTNEKEEKIEKLQKEIIDLIKKKLVKNINELEVLQSELYLLKEVKGEDVYLKDCQEDIKEIKKLLSKVKALKEKYDYLKDNVDFEYMLEYGDDLLIDKILELKDLCSSDDIKYTVDNYKILDEYKFLYLKIDKLEEDTVKYEEYKSKEEEKLKKRDIDFDKLKNDVYDVDRDKERYENFVWKQKEYLKELEDKISHIDSYEKVSYRLKGFNQLLGNSFKYLGLLLLNPLKGLVPGIATQTLITKNLIHNLYNNLEWEEDRRMVYDAIDYSDSINMAINNLDDTSSLIDSTLEEIVKMKSKYEKEFSKYESSFSGYRDAIKKINKMENAVLGSKIKIELMRQRMLEKEKQNNNKMKMVKKLNSSVNS